MNQTVFQFGDKVRHLKRPEWGIGMVTKVENISGNGSTSQRTTVRFPSEGVKVFSSEYADLEVVNSHAADDSRVNLDDEVPSLEFWDRLAKSGWLEPLAQRKIQTVMTALPPAVSDPFIGLPKRILMTLDLYRFNASGRSLIDWAVAQTGLSDPMTRFTRHELETFFQRWAFARDAHLTRLLQDARTESVQLQDSLKSVPPFAQEALRRVTSAMR
ncbi:MAG TPA: DUF3553 domain-containing protein [Phycisphaerales bacterium]|nr:DUF3553 domain-containing protein [Phycisphaerales bacterium]